MSLRGDQCICLVQYNDWFLSDILLLVQSKPLFLYGSMVLLSMVCYYYPLNYALHCLLFCYARWLCMAVNISIQYNGRLLPDIILLTQGYYHRGTRSNTMSRPFVFTAYETVYYYYHVGCCPTTNSVSVLFLLFVWCPCMAINVSVQNSGGRLPDIIMLTQCYCHRGTR